MCDSTLELKDEFAWIAVILVLLNRILHTLLREFILQLDSEHRKSIDHETHIKRQQRVCWAVVQLAHRGEAVRVVVLLGLRVARRRRTKEQINVMRAVLHACAQHINDSTARDLLSDSIK